MEGPGGPWRCSCADLGRWTGGRCDALAGARGAGAQWLRESLQWTALLCTTKVPVVRAWNQAPSSFGGWRARWSNRGRPARLGPIVYRPGARRVGHDGCAGTCRWYGRAVAGRGTAQEARAAAPTGSSLHSASPVNLCRFRVSSSSVRRVMQGFVCAARCSTIDLRSRYLQPHESRWSESDARGTSGISVYTLHKASDAVCLPRQKQSKSKEQGNQNTRIQSAIQNVRGRSPALGPICRSAFPSPCPSKHSARYLNCASLSTAGPRSTDVALPLFPSPSMYVVVLASHPAR